jgi:hypothetical protein
MAMAMIRWSKVILWATKVAASPEDEEVADHGGLGEPCSRVCSVVIPWIRAASAGIIQPSS